MRPLSWTLAMWGWMVTCAPSAVGEPYAPRVGQRHPDFTLPILNDRRPVSLSSFRGKKVLLIHFAAW